MASAHQVWEDKSAWRIDTCSTEPKVKIKYMLLIQKLCNISDQLSGQSAGTVPGLQLHVRRILNPQASSSSVLEQKQRDKLVQSMDVRLNVQHRWCLDREHPTMIVPGAGHGVQGRCWGRLRYSSAALLHVREEEAREPIFKAGEQGKVSWLLLKLLISNCGD